MGVREWGAGRSRTTCGYTRDQPVKGVAGAVLQRNFDAHNR